MRRRVLTLGWAALLAACPPPDPVETDGETDVTDTDPVDTDEPPDSLQVPVLVTLDGAPVEGAKVVQGGANTVFETGPDGTVDATLDLTVRGEWVLHASHPDARINFLVFRDPPAGQVTIALERFAVTDNPEYAFQDPGTPIRNDSTLMCSHCHRTFAADWHESPHRTSALNPELHDLYAGAVASLATEGDCAAAGGTWAIGVGPGTGAPAERCYLGSGVLPELDPSCAPNCDGRAAAYGACADCHAPGIDGQLGGRDLLDATGWAHDYGVHCDVCHKVESVDLDNPDPGVAGRLAIVRPSEVPDMPIAGPWTPLQFGPHHDISNPRMGSVQRDHYENGQLCAGCHEYDQAALVPDATVDAGRWPTGRFPVHSTYAEWKTTPFADRVPCNACHMPPAAEVWNGADLQLFDVTPGVAGGWARPPGATRHHSWVGPRTESSDMLQLAGAVDVEVQRDGERLEARVTTSNVGAGHRLPTGEPSRTVVLHVRATCDGTALDAIGGDVVPEFVGALATRSASDDWSLWPEAHVGDTVRVLSRSGWYDLDGHGPFGDGRFDAAAKGLPRWELVGVRTITSLDAGVATFDQPLPSGDVAWLGPPLDLDDDGAPARSDAGAPGFAFARVLADEAGQLMVPHHRAIDVVADNRLAPHTSLTTSHVFAATCDDPVVTARLTWRAYPTWLATEKRWMNPEITMTEGVR